MIDKFILPISIIGYILLNLITLENDILKLQLIYLDLCIIGSIPSIANDMKLVLQS